MVTAPYGVYRSKDAWLIISQSPLDVLGEALDNDRLRAMTDWNDGARYRDEIYEIVSAIIPTRTTQEWIEVFDRLKLWCGPVYNYADLEHDPHVIATEMVTSVEHPQIGALRMPNVPVQMSDTPATIRSAPPLLGQHTEEVLRTVAGCTDEQIQALRAAGVIG
jgi:crotonobetainyl-CoA:carnitine CoA-transferase CaiB-like acyl-CoA transferase